MTLPSSCLSSLVRLSRDFGPSRTFRTRRRIPSMCNSSEFKFQGPTCSFEFLGVLQITLTPQCSDQSSCRNLAFFRYVVNPWTGGHHGCQTVLSLVEELPELLGSGIATSVVSDFIQVHALKQLLDAFLF